MTFKSALPMKRPTRPLSIWKERLFLMKTGLKMADYKLSGDPAETILQEIRVPVER